MRKKQLARESAVLQKKRPRRNWEDEVCAKKRKEKEKLPQEPCGEGRAVGRIINGPSCLKGLQPFLARRRDPGAKDTYTSRPCSPALLTYRINYATRAGVLEEIDIKAGSVGSPGTE
ncbi:hypothetical protein MTO96_036318 [Rhipicephalus appendiculatus]